jgi:hypothetical protein
MASGRSYDSARQGSLTTIDPLEFALEKRDQARADEGAGWEATFDSGRSIAVDSSEDGTDRVTVRGTSGAVELEVTLTDRGPVLHFRAAEIQLESSGTLGLECQDLEVRAHGDAQLAAQGDLRLGAARGDVRIVANDDVRLNGERVKLNC